MSTFQLPFLETARLRMRPFSLRDAASVEMLAGDAEVARYTSNIPHPYPPGGAAKWIARHLTAFIEQEAVTLALERRDDGTLVGAIHLSLVLPHERGEIGYWIGRPSWNQGFATEAARGMVDYAFEEWSLQKVQAYHFTQNPASGRVLEKCGMSLEGVLRRHIVKDGIAHDLAGYGILREEWENRAISPV